MLRTFAVALMAGWLAFAGQAQAQATADQLNKLSLESLTAPSPGGGGGYRPTPHRRYAAGPALGYGRPRGYGHRARPYARLAYHRPYRGAASRYRTVPHNRYAATHRYYGRHPAHRR